MINQWKTSPKNRNPRFTLAGCPSISVPKKLRKAYEIFEHVFKYFFKKLLNRFSFLFEKNMCVCVCVYVFIMILFQ